MKQLVLNQDARVKEKFANYPEHILPLLMNLRSLILEAAGEANDIQELEETLKWNEPSYLAKKGSTLRFDWKAKKPEQYALYFKCTSKLIPIIKQLYGDTFTYENTRAIVFNLDDNVPRQKLKHCISLALRYHLIKDQY